MPNTNGAQCIMMLQMNLAGEQWIVSISLLLLPSSSSSSSFVNASSIVWRSSEKSWAVPMDEIWLKFMLDSCGVKKFFEKCWSLLKNVGHLWKWGEKWKKLEDLFILLISTQPRFLKWKFSAWVSQSKFSSWVSHIQKWGEVVIFWRLVRGGT